MRVCMLLVLVVFLIIAFCAVVAVSFLFIVAFAVFVFMIVIVRHDLVGVLLVHHRLHRQQRVQRQRPIQRCSATAARSQRKMASIRRTFELDPIVGHVPAQTRHNQVTEQNISARTSPTAACA